MSGPVTLGDLSLAGFSLAKRRPGVLIVRTLVHMACLAAGLYGMLRLLGDDLIALFQPPAPGTVAAPPEVTALAGKVWVIEGGWILGLVVVGSIMACQVYRAVLRPRERAFGSLRLGGDELRMMALSIMLTAIFGAVILVVWGSFVSGALVLSRVNPWAGLAVGALGILLSLALMLWMAVKFSLAGPATFAERRLSLGLGKARGRFAALLGLGVGVVLIAVAISTVAGLVLNPMMQSLFYQMSLGAGPEAAMRGAAPILALAGLLGSLLYALNGMVMLAPFAAAYARIVGGDEREVETSKPID